jgi:NAD(P)-dependent dehydrogenase (short-subunit alcohol dehydrogenase family)
MATDTTHRLELLCGSPDHLTSAFIADARERLVPVVLLSPDPSAVAAYPESMIADTLDPLAVASALADIAERHGTPTSVTILASQTEENVRAEDISASQWQCVLDDLLTRTFVVAQAAAGQMIAAGGGSIVVISSLSSLGGISGQAHVCAAAAGILGLVETAALEWGHDAVRINLVAVSPLENEGATSAETLGMALDRTPTSRLTRPSDVLGAARFLHSPDASQITGTALTVDGGLNAGLITRWNGTDFASNALLERGVYIPR